MRLLGLAAIYQRPNTSKPAAAHKIYPYLLRGLTIEQVNQVWCSDITYIPMAKGFLYLVVIMDWVSRAVLAWRLSNTLDADFCVEALEEALSRYGRPEIFNTDQGSQFTSDDFTGTLKQHGVMISMDGKGRCMDNIFVERLWRSLKYEEVYLNAYATVAEAKAGIGSWLDFYNTERQHQSLGYRPPWRIYQEGLWICGRSAPVGSNRNQNVSCVNCITLESLRAFQIAVARLRKCPSSQHIARRSPVRYTRQRRTIK
jgi:putative transposase